MSKPRDLSKLFTSNTNITTDVELISTVNSASAYALSEANDYTDSELSSIDLTSTINTASAAAFSSASVYTNSAIASFQALPSQSGNAGKYLSTSGSVTSWQALDLNAAINTASAAAVTYLVDSAPGSLDTLNELAAALGDDQNFATTVTNALGAKLNSSTASTTYLTQSGASSTYLTQAAGLTAATASATYLTQSNASATYATKAEAQNSLDRWTKVYSASATTISGLDDTSNTLLYTQNFENLYINGILQDPTNYTATSGSTIILNQAVVTNDVVEIISINPFNVANTYTQTQSDNKFLNLISASNTYITQSSASTTYLTQSNASSLYLTQSSASNSYLTQSSASNSYLTQVGASNVYTLKTNGALTNPAITDGSLKDTVVKGLEEDINIVASSASATINLDIDTASILYYTSSASANHTLNIRYSSSASLNSKLPINDTVTVVWMNTNGSTPYRPTTIQIDGSSVTPLWLGGSAPSAGNASSIDVYTFTIIKTASATYTVLGSQSQYKA
jgi:hypothetical protein